MRISELASRSGIPVPTIKYYIREGLLPRGDRTASNQAEYDSTHVSRLALIRSLREVADLPIATIAEVVISLDEPAALAHSRHITTALRALEPDRDKPSDQAEKLAAKLAESRGWLVERDSPGYRTLLAGLTALEEHWASPVDIETLDRYAAVAETLAGIEIPDDWQPTEGGMESVAYAVLGTVLFEPVILALRRLAHADRHRRLTGQTPPEVGS